MFEIGDKVKLIRTFPFYNFLSSVLFEVVEVKGETIEIKNEFHRISCHSSMIELLNKRDIKNLEINQTFKFDNEKYKVVEGGCNECDLLVYCKNCIKCKDSKPNCFSKARDDKKSVMFKKV